MFVFEVHVVLLLGEFVHLVELVHVELPHEGRQVAVPEEVRQHLLLQLLPALYQDLPISMPR